MKIRPATPADAAALVAIYAPYVTDTAITFEIEVPSASDFAQRIHTISQQFPYLVAEGTDGALLGYAYASSYKNRAAYDWTVELSVYVDQTVRHHGIGKALYDELERQLVAMGIVNFLACIALPNEPSIAFHLKRGYEQVAHFKEVGYKFDQWHDIVWLQKQVLTNKNR
ncbi:MULTISPECIES: N-acetyltransferase family protein [unclassified Streptococcus]|uniref:GNAT family N-acetyltransferase n=1 Tax=unclassified Streptococcus TaxID=2608887 RepID=UPI00359D1EEF